VRGLIDIYFKQQFLNLLWYCDHLGCNAVCCHHSGWTCYFHFREDNNQTAQLHNLETTRAVETSDFLFLAASVIVY